GRLLAHVFASTGRPKHPTNSGNYLLELDRPAIVILDEKNSYGCNRIVLGRYGRTVILCCNHQAQSRVAYPCTPTAPPCSRPAG
ncbi:MAG TPA: hypothetical protein VKD90_20640, partial [Gemmataceae bacterium]|nr:hypothetical protein [Gemmataceae bacterium]